jgi:hypothetical protein
VAACGGDACGVDRDVEVAACGGDAYAATISRPCNHKFLCEQSIGRSCGQITVIANEYIIWETQLKPTIEPKDISDNPRESSNRASRFTITMGKRNLSLVSDAAFTPKRTCA